MLIAVAARVHRRKLVIDRKLVKKLRADMTLLAALRHCGAIKDSQSSSRLQCATSRRIAPDDLVRGRLDRFSVDALIALAAAGTTGRDTYWFRRVEKESNLQP